MNDTERKFWKDFIEHLGFEDVLEFHLYVNFERGLPKIQVTTVAPQDGRGCKFEITNAKVRVEEYTPNL